MGCNGGSWWKALLVMSVGLNAILLLSVQTAARDCAIPSPARKSPVSALAANTTREPCCACPVPAAAVLTVPPATLPATAPATSRAAPVTLQLRTVEPPAGFRDPSSRDCEHLIKDDCNYHTETDKEFYCNLEHASRLMYLSWFRPDAKVLEVGARYGQASCLISRVLNRESGGVLFSSDADAKVWDHWERNVKDNGCWGTLVRGPVGQTSLKVGDGSPAPLTQSTYGKRSYKFDDPRPGLITVKAIPLELLGTTFDTLAIDCEGCLSGFLEENPKLMESLTMIIAEIHTQDEVAVVKRLMREGWTLKQEMRRQRVLCKGNCESQCDQRWVTRHAVKYFNGQVQPMVF